MKQFKFLISIFALFLLIIPFAYADSVIIRDANTTDSFVLESQANNNYGDNVDIIIAGGPSPNVERGYIAFHNLTTVIPSGSTILDAELYVYVRFNDGTNIINVYDVNTTKPWGEMDLTWVNQPCGLTSGTIAGECNTTVASSVTIDDIGWKKFNVTTIINRARSEGRENASVLIAYNSEGAATNKYFRSRHYTVDETLHPYLNISYTAGAPPAGEIINNTMPVINISYPANSSTIDNSTYPIFINGTVTIQNGTVANLTINSTYWKNLGNNTKFNFTFNGTFSEGLYILNLSANSTDGNRTSTIVIFSIDITKPNLISNLDNNHTLYYAHQNITFQINATDNLRVYTFNVSTSEGFVFNITGLNTTKYIYNGSINASNYGIGKHILISEVCDAHTSFGIADYNTIIDKDTKEILFDFTAEDTRNLFEKLYLPAPTPRKIYILPLKPTLFIETSTRKEKDRYVFSYTKANSKDANFSFIVSSTHHIDIIGNDKGYYGWLVVPKLSKWIDFNTNEVGNVEYKIKRISDIKIQIDVNGISMDKFEFNSIGDLNCYKETWDYYIFNYTASYSSSVVETTKDLLTFVIDFKNIALKGNGTLSYQNIVYNITNFTSINQINLTINFTIPQVGGNQTNATFFYDFVLNSSAFTSINFTQLIERLRLGTCGADTEVRTLNISTFNENNINQYLESSIDAIFTIWTNDSGNTVNFTFNLNDETNYSICIFPNTTLYTNAYLQYNTSGGFRQRWFLTNAKLTTNTSMLYLYNFNSVTGISTLKGTLKDENYAEFPLVITKLQRRYINENAWRTVQMDRSDDFGLVLFNIIEKTQDYRMIFEKGNAEIDRTNSLKFICTATLCDITFTIRQLIVTTTPNLKIKTGYDNVSEMYQLNFSDTTGLTSKVNLVVTREKGASISTICDMTVTASDGTINCNTTGYDGALIARVFSSALPTMAFLTEFINKLKNKLFQMTNEYMTRNEYSLWAMGISSTLIIAGSIINPIAGIITYIFSLIIINLLGIVNFMTITLTTLMIIGGIIVSVLISKRKE